MKYLVLKSEKSIEFVVFDGPGYHLSISGEKSNVPFYVRQYVNQQNGTFSISEVRNYSGGSLFILENCGCNILTDDKLLPQGVSVIRDGQKFTVGRLTIFLIDEEDKADIEANFYIENHYEENHWRPETPPAIDDDFGFSEDGVPPEEENWDEDEIIR